tara:strand:- start:706 stop:1212 length:507 start_codon:yes stop_codon:yes gene_type:complete
MKKVFLAALAVSCAFATSGCATVLNGTNVDYTTETKPEGATARFTSGQECTTPCELEMRRKDDQRVDLYAEGYKPTYVLIQSKLGGSTFGNILAGGGIGAVVDGSNGASNRLYPRPLIVKLAPVGSNEEAVLLDEDGNVTMTVKEHNDSVRADVAKTIGAELAGLNDQ